MAYTKTTWATSDVITATKLNNAENGIEDAHDGTVGMVLIGDTEVTGSPVSAITVSSLSSYRFIKFMLSAKAETSDANLDIIFNSDTTSGNYSYDGYRFDTSSGNTNSSSSSDKILIGGSPSAIDSVHHVTLIAEINNHDGEYKDLLALYRRHADTIRYFGGTYNQTTVISSMTLTPANDFSVGTRLMIWGCK